jgi:hypothetical protein
MPEQLLTTWASALDAVERALERAYLLPTEELARRRVRLAAERTWL